MANLEVNTISAVCKNKDISAVLAENIDQMFVGYGDVWLGLKSYYHQFKSIPDASVLTEKFPDFQPVETKGETAYYVDELKNYYIQNQVGQILLKTGESLQSDGGIKSLRALQKDIMSLSRLTSQSRDLDITDYEAASRHFEAVRERSELMGGSPGIPTGFKAIDTNYHTGMAPGHFIVAIGWPGRGKTFITGYLAVKAWEAGFKPMIVSLEMSPETLRDRIYATMGRGMFNMRDISRGNVNMDNYHEWSKKYFTNKNGFIIVSNDGEADITPMTIQAKIDQHKPDLVIVDYHQLLNDNKRSNNEVERQRNISRELKLLAVRNSIPVVDISAATMGDISDQDAPPMLSQVAWAKSIEYDADHAFAVHLDHSTGIIEIVCRKNRHGNPYDFYVEADLGNGIFKEIYGEINKD
jgi:replicative DNA helicase